MNQILATAFHGLVWYLVLAVVVAVLVAVLRSPRFKGWRGERAVQRTIAQKLNPLIYSDLHNVTLPTKDGSTQIDHLIFSPYGLFVLETKNYQGWIFGSENQREWTQQIFKKRSKFQNPLRQNYKHTKTLQDLLGLAPEQVHSVIAFVGDCEFKTEMPPQVTRGDGFVGYIHSFAKTIWTPEEMQALMDKLEEVRLQPGRETDKQHVAHVKDLQATKTAKTARKPRAAMAKQTAEQALVPAEPLTQVDVLLDLDSPVAAPAAMPMVSAAAVVPEPAQKAVDPELCPQCTWPLRKLVMQRGPLAGQAIWRCSNTAVCNFVRAQE